LEFESLDQTNQRDYRKSSANKKQIFRIEKINDWKEEQSS